MSEVVKVRNLEIGEGTAKICVPVVGNNKETIVKQAEAVIDMEPDIV